MVVDILVPTKAPCSIHEVCPVCLINNAYNLRKASSPSIEEGEEPEKGRGSSYLLVPEEGGDALIQI